MKKVLLLLVVLVTAFSMFGCSSYSANKLNEIVFEDILTYDEKQYVLERIDSNFLSCSKVTIDREAFLKYGQVDESNDSHMVITIYRNYYVHGEGTIKAKYIDSGVGYQNEKKAVMDIWCDEEMLAVIHHSLVGDDEKYQIVQSYLGASNPEQEKMKSYEYLWQLVKSTVNYNTNLQGYKTKDGYALVMTDKDEEYNGVEWGSSVKQLYNLEEEQVIVLINSEYQITEIISYQSRVTNRDPQTGEWYSKNKEIVRESVTIKIAYNSRKENPDGIEKLNKDYELFLKKNN